MRSYPMKWVLATFGAWVLGIPFSFLLGSLGDIVHLSGQSCIGIGMGACIGFAQWRVGRKWFGATSGWMWATLVGLSVPFIVWDLLHPAADDLVMFVLPPIGGLLIGAWQWRTLRLRTGRAEWWIVASSAGWTIACLSVALLVGSHPDSLLRLVANLAAIVLGGPVLGLITAAALTWIIGTAPADAPQQRKQA